MLTALLCLLSVSAGRAQEPIYLINGHEVTRGQLKDYTPTGHDSLRLEVVRDPEEAVKRFGEKGRYGICNMTLAYDIPAIFPASPQPFVRSLYDAIEGWDTVYAAESIRILCRISEEGKITVERILVSDNPELLEKITAFIASSPAWIPAKKDGKPVASDFLVDIRANK